MPSATRPSTMSFPLAGLATALGVVAAAIVVLTAPASAWIQVAGPGLVLPPGVGTVAAAGVVAAAAWRLADTSEDTAATLLVLGCLLAGAGANAAAWALTAPTGAAPVPDPWLRARVLVAYLDLFAVSSLVATLWAAAPGRTLGRWVGPLGAAVVVLTTAGAWVRAAGYPGSATTGPDLSVVWRAGLGLLAMWTLGALGSLRTAGLAHLAAGRPAPRARTSQAAAPLAAWATGVLAAVGCVAAAAEAMAGGHPGDALGPLLWLLVGLVALRWSRVAAWAAFALCLSLAASLVVGSSAVAGWALLVGATVAGWSALATAVPGRAAVVGRSVAVVAALVAGLPALAAGGDGGAVDTVWAPAAGFPVTGVWTPALVFVPVGLAALAVLRRRLVPAIAEAEAVAGDPFVPSRYAAALVAELVTRQGRVRAEAAELERRRLASDLHADVLPGLARAAADTAAGAPADAVSARLRAVESDVRGLLAERRHVVLEELGLVEALEWLVGRAEEASALEVTLDVDPASTGERPPTAVERSAFRVAQLGVDNAVRHAAATRLALEVLVRADRVRVAVADDGRGFEPALPSEGFGLADMRLQAAEVAGRVEVGSRPGAGTRVVFSWPR